MPPSNDQVITRPLGPPPTDLEESFLSAVQSGEWDKAIELGEQLIWWEPDSSSVRTQLIQCYVALGSQLTVTKWNPTQELHDIGTRALELESDNPDAMVLLALGSRANNWEMAKERIVLRLQAAIDIASTHLDVGLKDATALRQRAMALCLKAAYSPDAGQHAQPELEQALRDIRAAIILAPREPEMYLVLGDVLLALNEHEDAAAAFSRAQALGSPQRARSSYFLGVAYAAAMTRATDSGSKHEQAELAEHQFSIAIQAGAYAAYEMRARLFIESNRFDEAFDDLARHADWVNSSGSAEGWVSVTHDVSRILSLEIQSMLFENAQRHLDRYVASISVGDLRAVDAVLLGIPVKALIKNQMLVDPPRSFLRSPVALSVEALVSRAALEFSNSLLGDLFTLQLYPTSATEQEEDEWRSALTLWHETLAEGHRPKTT